MSLGRAEKIERVHRGESDCKRGRIGEADIFAGHAHQAAREVERVFAGFEHAREPVESGVGIGIAHGLVQRGDEIEMLLARFVVGQKLVLQHVFETFARDDAAARGIGRGAEDHGFESVVGGASIAIGDLRDAVENVVGDFDLLVAEAAFFVGERAMQKVDDLLGGKRVENVNLHARKQRRDDFEGGIFGGGADQQNVPAST